MILLDALNQLTIECLEKVSNNEISQNILNSQMISGSFDPSLKQKIFGLTKMQEVINVNLFRIDVFWELVIAHFLCIANSKNSNLRKMAVETLNNFISSGFVFFFAETKKGSNTHHNIEEEQKDKENPKKKEIIQKNLLFSKEKWSFDNWQKTLLQPWLDVIRCKFNETKETIINSLLRLLQDNGHEITNSGWSVILNILKEVSEENNANYTNTGKILKFDKIVIFL